MLFNLITTLPLLGAISSVLAEPAPYKIGRMSSSANPLGFIKRQAGYQPTESYCGSGDTCAEACGAGSETCPSSGDGLYCYNPTIGDTCCPNLSGDSCSEGYYCTEDSASETWCCPNGLDLAACQAAYSITGALVPLTGSAAGASSSAPPPTTSAGSPPITSGTNSVPSAPPTTATGSPVYGNATTPVLTVTRTTTTTGVTAATTATTATTSKGPVFTGGANSLFSETGSQMVAIGIFGLLAIF